MDTKDTANSRPPGISRWEKEKERFHRDLTAFQATYSLGLKPRGGSGGRDQDCFDVRVLDPVVKL